jgi:GT2 family glycosyltransferase
VPRLSIIIPVLGDPRQFEETLVSVLENRPADCEVLVALNQAYDDPYDLSDEVRVVSCPGRAGLAAVVNAALAVGRGPIIHVLGCGVEVRPGWSDAALSYFDDPQVASVAPLLLNAADPQRIATAGLDYAAGGVVRAVGRGKPAATAGRLRAELLGPDLAAAFYRRSALAAVEGFSESVGTPWVGMDTALRLAVHGWQAVLAPESHATTDPAKLARPNALRRGWQAERFFWRWAPAEGWAYSLAAHALHLAVRCLACVVRPSGLGELLGRAAATATIPAHRSHWRAIRAAIAHGEAPCGGLPYDADDYTRREAA